MIPADGKPKPGRGRERGLSIKQIKRRLSELGEKWKVERKPDRLVKELEFEDFYSAIAFVNRVAKLAEEKDHHPNLYIHNYKKVRVELWTHSVGGLSKNDFILASSIEYLY